MSSETIAASETPKLSLPSEPPKEEPPPPPTAVTVESNPGTGDEGLKSNYQKLSVVKYLTLDI